jgi:hypothetical protein
MRFEVVLTPWSAADEGFVQASDAAVVDRFVEGFARGDLSPPTDDRPFFFKMDDRLLNGLLRAVVLLTLTFIVAPVLLKAEPRVLRESAALSTGFAAIGLGFMLIEIAAMQRLILLLGHPTFSLSVVLFGLLVSSGLGSFVVGRSSTTTLERLTRVRFLTLVGVLVAAGAAMPAAIDIFDGFSTPVRVAVSLALLMPAGFMMGMAFPLAMRIGLLGRPAIAPWLWGINGAASVTASVLAVLISSTWGISAAWWTGVACYLVAAVAIGAAARAAERIRPASFSAASPAGTVV